jgi:hypothetical protein
MRPVIDVSLAVVRLRVREARGKGEGQQQKRSPNQAQTSLPGRVAEGASLAI